MQITPVILSYGPDASLSLLSRDQYPRQYLPSEVNTIMQETILRIYELGAGYDRALDTKDKMPSKDEINLCII